MLAGKSKMKKQTAKKKFKRAALKKDKWKEIEIEIVIECEKRPFIHPHLLWDQNKIGMCDV